MTRFLREDISQERQLLEAEDAEVFVKTSPLHQEERSASKPASRRLPQTLGFAGEGRGDKDL